MNVAIARLFQDAGFQRWKGHDMQVRAYDSEEQGIERVIRSILSWEACDRAAKEMDTDRLMDHLQHRDTVKAEDMIRSAVVQAQKFFDKMYRS
jgi:xylose isomerase